MKLVASDLDGTLLDHDQKIPPLTSRVLTEMVAQGVTFVFATGRHSEDVRWLHERLDIPAWKITANGAQVLTPKDEHFWFKALPKALVSEVLAATEGISVATNVYTDRLWLTNHQQVVDYSAARDFDFTAQKVPLVARDDVIKIFFMGEHSDLRALEARINERVQSPMSMTFSLPTCLEVMASKVNKGEALRRVCQHLGVELGKVWAFGDGMNDVEMLQTAGNAFIMENSFPELPIVLPELPVIGKNTDEAVARTLAAHLGIAL